MIDAGRFVRLMGQLLAGQRRLPERVPVGPSAHDGMIPPMLDASRRRGDQNDDERKPNHGVSKEKVKRQKEKVKRGRGAERQPAMNVSLSAFVPQHLCAFPPLIVAIASVAPSKPDAQPSLRSSADGSWPLNSSQSVNFDSTRQPAGESRRSDDRSAQCLGDFSAVGHDLGENVGSDRLGSVAACVGWIGVHFDDQSVGSRGDGGGAHRRNQ